MIAERPSSHPTDADGPLAMSANRVNGGIPT